MFTELMTSDEIKQIISENFFNKTNKVTKIADNSNLNGFFFGLAKATQKALKDIGLIEASILPEEATGDLLDKIANWRGIAPRFGASGSSTYVRLVGTAGTAYLKTTHIFQSTSGIAFELDADTTIPSVGYTYAKVRSQDVGIKTKVDPLSITKLSPTPAGHSYVINEYRADGGRDAESDEDLLQRIIQGPNILAKDTLAYLTQALLKINENVLRVVYQGSNGLGKNVVSVISQNGIDFNNTELGAFQAAASKFFSFVDHRTYENKNTGLIFQNVTWFPIDVSLRVKLDVSLNPDDIRKEMQARMSKILDPRTWSSDKIFEWEDFLIAAKQTTGVEYLADVYFSPNKDMILPKNNIPRVRGFQMLDLDGNLISNSDGSLNPIYFPQQIDFSFQNTVLNKFI